MTLHQTAPKLFRVYFLGFCLVVAQVAYWQIVRADELGSNQHNVRYWTRVRSVERGRILDRRGQELAVSKLEDASAAKEGDADVPAPVRRRLYQREYPFGRLTAHVVGYSDWRMGSAGVESAMAGQLSPPGGVSFPHSLWEVFAPQPARGNDVTLTLDVDLQKRAAAALGDRAGAVVVLDVATGAVLAMVDYPTYDPAAVRDPKAWDVLLHADSTNPLVPRAVQGTYPPGSTFKLLTAAAALEAGVVTPDSAYDCKGVLKLPFCTVKCDVATGHGHLTLSDAIARSCNITLAQVALSLGADRWQRTVTASGLGRRFDLYRPGKGKELVAPGQVPTGAELTLAELAACGYGQGALAVTPLYLASVAQMLGNHGLRCEPYLVERVSGPDGRTVVTQTRDAGTPVVSARTADEVVAMMRRVMESGGTGAGLSGGLDMAGKTGSAQNPHGQAHSWFVALAPAGAPRYAVAVIVENAGWGRTAAAPVAVKVLKAALGR